MSMRTLVLLCLALASISISGCHCCRVSECYADRIDDFADHKDFARKLDGIYCEQLDVTRLCMNRRCGPCCCPQCQGTQYRTGN